MTVETEDRAIVSLLSSTLTETLDYFRLPYFEKLFPARMSAAKWIQDYVFKNESIPTKKQLRRHHGDIDTVQKPEPLDYTMDILREELVRETSVNANNKASELYEKDDLKGFQELMQAMCDEIAEYGMPVRDAEYEDSDYITDQQAQLDENPDGMLMLPTGIKPYDEEYGGLEKGVIYTLSALINLGKTYLACHVAEAIRQTGANVLFYTLEMPKDKIAERLYCVRYKLDADQHARKKQPDASKKAGETYTEWWQSCLNDLKKRVANDPNKDAGRVIIREAGESAVTPRMIANDIRRYEAGAVIIDAAQDIRDNHQLRERTPGLYRALSELNGVCMRHKVPALLTVQLDPEVERKGLKKGNLTRIQWGQVFAQKSGAVMTMVGDRSSPARELTVDKARDGTVGRRFEGHFHFPHVELEFYDIDPVNISFEDEEVAEDVDAMEAAIREAEKEVEKGNKIVRGRPSQHTREGVGESDDSDVEESRGTESKTTTKSAPTKPHRVRRPPPKRREPVHEEADVRADVRGEDDDSTESNRPTRSGLGSPKLQSRGFRKKF